jgi:hypothetical protein
VVDKDRIVVTNRFTAHAKGELYMALQWMGVPGTVARPEVVGGSAVLDDRPLTNVDGIGSTDLTGFAQGGVIRFRGKANHQNWFHLPIPTPVFREDQASQRAKLTRVYVGFRLQERSARVRAVHINDGPNPIHQFPALNLSDEEWFEGDVDTRPEISYGVGLSMLVDFGRTDGDVAFTGATATFEV